MLWRHRLYVVLSQHIWRGSIRFDYTGSALYNSGRRESYLYGVVAMSDCGHIEVEDHVDLHKPSLDAVNKESL